MRIPRGPSKLKKKRMFVVVGVIILIALVAGLAINVYKNNSSNKKTQNCEQHLSKLQDLVENNKSGNDVTSIIKQINEDKCGDLPDKPAAFSLLYYESMGAFINGDKDGSKEYAKRALALNKSMNDDERAKVESQRTKIFNLSDLEDGAYTKTEPAGRVIVKDMNEGGN